MVSRCDLELCFSARAQESLAMFYVIIHKLRSGAQGCRNKATIRNQQRLLRGLSFRCTTSEMQISLTQVVPHMYVSGMLIMDQSEPAR